MRKFELLFKKIAKFRADMRNSANSRSVKDLIGDSVNNNRTVTVNQTIRYLDYTGQTTAASRLAAAHEILISDIKYQRKADGVKRSDAIDLDEFVRVYREKVMNKKTLRRSISRVLRGI